MIGRLACLLGIHDHWFAVVGFNTELRWFGMVVCRRCRDVHGGPQLLDIYTKEPVRVRSAA
jgi:hypothetical protein